MKRRICPKKAVMVGSVSVGFLEASYVVGSTKDTSASCQAIISCILCRSFWMSVNPSSIPKLPGERKLEDFLQGRIRLILFPCHHNRHITRPSRRLVVAWSIASILRHRRIYSPLVSKNFLLSLSLAYHPQAEVLTLINPWLCRVPLYIPLL